MPFVLVDGHFVSKPIPLAMRRAIYFFLKPSLASSLVRLLHTSAPMRPRTNPSWSAHIPASMPFSSVIVSYNRLPTIVGGSNDESRGGMSPRKGTQSVSFLFPQESKGVACGGKNLLPDEPKQTQWPCQRLSDWTARY